ncbi:MAG: MFS transporter [Planctomycetes bacterium]|nr:MFS transporter [Planctomycetota bacterium]
MNSIRPAKLVAVIGGLGFASGLPNVMVTDTLSAWLADLKIDIKTIGLFALVTLPYAFKFVWSPLLDRFAVPGFGWLGARRSWLIVLQALLLVALLALAWCGPEHSGSPLMAFALIALATSMLSATLDIAVDAHRSDVSQDEKGPAASAYVAGYRMAFVLAGSLALVAVAKVAPWLESSSEEAARATAWRIVYAGSAGLLFIGLISALLAPEPTERQPPQSLREAIVAPLLAFHNRFHGRLVLVLVFIFLFRLPDLLGNRMTMPFLRNEIGFTLEEIGFLRQALGFAMTMAGAVIGGIAVKRFGISRTLLVFGLLQCLSNAGYIVLAQAGRSVPTFACVIVIENLCNGMVSAAFVAYFMSLCDRTSSAAQYALLSGVMYLAGATIGGASGWLVELMGYQGFFLFSILIGIPAIALIGIATRPARINPSFAN